MELNKLKDDKLGVKRTFISIRFIFRKNTWKKRKYMEKSFILRA